MTTPARRPLPRPVWLLGGAALLNDAAADMVAPLLPLLLTATLGAGPAVVGLIEGVADAVSSVLKLYSGRLADRGHSARALIVGGYGLSNLARPLLGLAGAWPVVMALRVTDRIGKGLRTSPRDALLAGAVDADQRGRAFGLHRSLDHAGAVLGPLLAAALLAAGLTVAQVLLVSVLPGLAVLGVLLLAIAPGTRTPPPPGGAPALRWRGLDARVRALIGASALLALGRLPDALLVLWAFGAGVPVAAIPLVWAAASAARAAVVYPAARISDRCGRLPVVLGGWSAQVAVALAALVWTARGGDGAVLYPLFLAWAAAGACTEGVERALLGDLAPPAHRAGVFGAYHMATGLAALPGGLLAGLIWQYAGPAAAFGASAAVTAVGAGMFWYTARAGGRPNRTDQSGAAPAPGHPGGPKAA